jgi:hypothetical protein
LRSAWPSTSGPRLGPDFPQDCTGNLAPLGSTLYLLSNVTDPPIFNANHRLPIALALKSKIAKASPEWLDERLRYLSSFYDPSKAFTRTFFANSAVMVVTSWQHLGAELVWDFPSVSADGKPSALRMPSYAAEGIRILLRRDEKDADYKMLVAVEEGDIER